jgi:hypothetical protein
MGERMGQIGRIRTDFLGSNQKKSVRIRPIRPIRSPIVPQSYHHRITTFRNPQSTIRNRLISRCSASRQIHECLESPHNCKMRRIYNY